VDVGVSGLASLTAFLQRVISDAALWQRALADPFGTLRAEGVAFDAQDVKQLLNIAGATDHELLEVIEAHLKRLDPEVGQRLLHSCTAYLFPDGLPEVRARLPHRVATGLPLDARPDAGPTAAQVAALRRLETYDLSPVEHWLLAEGSLPPAWVEEAVYEFRRYLGMRLVFARTFAMFSEQVDEVWHTTLLFTELYADLCQQTFGYFAHHDPWDEPKPEQVAELWRSFAEAYHLLYGKPSYLWTIRSPQGTALAATGSVILQPAPSGGAR